jgi:hypothetical protein
VYFLEAGLLLLVVPWSVFWERNLFVGQWSALQAVLLNHFVRGGISGVGLVCLGAAISEVLTLWRSRTQVAGADEPSTYDADLSAH